MTASPSRTAASSRRISTGRRAALAVLVALVWAQAASADPLEPLGVTVEGGEQAWRADTRFVVSWSNPPGVAAVHYRVLHPGGAEVDAETRLDWPARLIRPLVVPRAPGAYTAEIWLEDALGAEGPAAAVTLRFDDSAPGPVEPEPVPGWIGNPDLPLSIRVGHPAGAPPASGIRGYAVAVDADAGASPCAGTLSCTEAETTLHEGAEGDTIALRELPEGVVHLNAVAVSGSGMRSASVGSTVLRVDRSPPATRLTGVPTAWSRRPVALTARADDALSGMNAVGSGSRPFTAIRVDGGAPIVAAGDRVAARVIGSGVHEISHYAGDAVGNVADGATVGGHRNPPPARAVVRIDRDPPRLAFAGAQDASDPERIEVRAADALSGVDRSRGTIAVRRAGSGERFRPLASRFSGSTLTARWDSDSYPRGEYEFRATGFDAAGNSATTGARSGGTAMRLRSPLKVRTRLLARVDRHGAGRGQAILGGRLLAGRRTPLGGTAVEVAERFDGGARRGPRTTALRTRRDGSFRLRLGPGPSRTVRVSLAPTPNLSGAASRPLRLAVRAGVRLRTSARVARVGGRPLTFSGRVRGGPVPAGGKAVELQFRVPGLPWRGFRTVRTDRRGRFRYRYRFADDDSRGVSFRFRAVAPAQAGWPYSPASSRPVTVRGV